MARAKKETALTPEERLQAALVPDWEWPYKLPENWCWTGLKNITTLLNGDRGVNYPSKKDYLPDGIPFINAGAIVDGVLDCREFYFISKQKYDSLRAGKVKQNDILYCLRGSLGKTAIVDFDGDGAISSSLCILRVNEATLAEYLYYLLNSEVISQQQDIAENGSAQPNLSAASVMQYSVPLPPLAEQQRIVDRIESLFAKLDEAKEKAQTVLDSFETRKAAILHEAFTGELTAKWREAHGVGMESWIETEFRKILDVRDGTHDSPQYYEHGYPLVTSKNLKNGIITDKDLKYISKDDYEQINMRSKVEIGDILFAMIGTIGNPVVISEEPKFAIKNVALFKNIGKANPYFVRYFLETKQVRNKMQRDAKGSTQKFVPLGYLRSYKIHMPNNDEQVEIVRILDELFAKGQQAKESAEDVLDRIDLMKKSILVRAFRGELGTNDPTDEPAIEILKRTMQQERK